MMPGKRIVVAGSLLVALLLAAGCAGESEPRPDDPPPEVRGKAAVDTAVGDWIPGNVDDIAEEIGSLVTGDIPIARDIATEAIRTALLARYELSVEHIEDPEGEDSYAARVGISFPVRITLPLLGEKEYLLRVAYDITIKNGEVIDSSLDASSFEMEDTSG